MYQSHNSFGDKINFLQTGITNLSQRFFNLSNCLMQ